MTDIETELREAMAAAVADSPLPVDPMDLIHRGTGGMPCARR